VRDRDRDRDPDRDRDCGRGRALRLLWRRSGDTIRGSARLTRNGSSRRDGAVPKRLLWLASVRPGQFGRRSSIDAMTAARCPARAQCPVRRSCVSGIPVSKQNHPRELRGAANMVSSASNYAAAATRRRRW